MKNFKTGNWISQGNYRSFQPAHIDRQWTISDMEIQHLLSQADRHLGRLDMYSEYVPNIDLSISMHMLKEATQSSRIEGTETRIEEALLDREDVPSEKRDDWEEVQNYITAMDHAVASLTALPISSRLICETHRVLMQGVRGSTKQPGEFRTSQNWIGGATINDAGFVPPVHTSIADLMSDLESFIHHENIYLPDLLKIALIHYQFETIHPFLDGNGRVGRLLIPLYLVEKEILKRPILYLSDFLERNRTQYYDNLMHVRQNGGLAHWFRFFLIGVIEVAKSGIATFDGILRLQKDIGERVRGLGSRASTADKVIQYLYGRPLIDASKVSEVASVSMPTAYKLIRDMEKLEILTEVTGAQRGRLYLFGEYMELFRS